MSQKAERPVLQGQRIKTRKRDEKEKYDPTGFRDAIVQGFNEAGTDLDQVSKFLDSSGGKLNYRRYAEPLFDVLFAGGILAPGGTLVEETDTTKVSRTDLCVFSATEAQLTLYYEVFFKLIRRYKYLEKSFNDELSKILTFLKGFKPEERDKLAKILALFIVNGLATSKPLGSLFEDHLTKEGISITFVTTFFLSWLKQRDIASLKSTLRKSQLDGRLLDFMPATRRSFEHFQKHFRDAGLGPIVDLQKNQQTTEVKKELLKELDDMIGHQETTSNIAVFVREHIEKGAISEPEAVVFVWNRLMNAVEWNKKEELVAEQAIRHLKAYAPLLAALAKSGDSELALMVKVQDYCYDNSSFMKVFQKIILLLYKADVLSEDVIFKWYRVAHSAKGKSVFLEQMKKFVEWLEQAEEESEEEDD